MIDPKNIQLTENELNKCLEFSEISAQNQQKIEFGQKTTSPRKVSEIARDNLIGKIAEVAFCKLLKENYGIDIELDSAYRSISIQNQLFEEFKEKYGEEYASNYAAPAGYSEHHT